MKKRKKSLHSVKMFIPSFLCFTLAGTLFLVGCGNNGNNGPEETVELHEPAVSSIIANTEPVIRRNLYHASLYESCVSPYVEEYSFETSQLFDCYCILPGKEVKKGDVLVKAIGDSLSEQIEEAEIFLKDLTAAYEKYCSETKEYLSRQQEELEFLEQVLSNLEAEKPQEYLPDTTNRQPDSTADTLPGEESQQIINPDYVAWQAQYEQWAANHSLTEYYIAVTQRELQLRADLFNLDYNYYNNQLKKLQNQRQKEIIRSSISGTVVGIGSFVHGDRVSNETPVIAVGDTGRKILNCSYISKRTLTRAKDLYALVNGRRYEVTELESDTPSSLFLLEDANDEIPMGAYAVLIIISDYREQVLTVPESCLHKENSADCVYVIEDGILSSRTVETGMTDGIYIEILSGLEEGEQVATLSDTNRPFTSAVLERGNAGISYQVKAVPFLPLKAAVYNPVESGTTFMKEYVPEISKYLKKGDIIAEVNVESDIMDISRRETTLQRDKERLADLIAENEESNEERIAEMQKSIQTQEEELARRKADYSTSEITSPVEGYLEYLSSCSSGEIIKPNARIAYVADKSAVYISMTPHYENIAAFGNLLEIEYYDDKHELHTGWCKAVTLLPSLLSPGLDSFVLLEPLDEVKDNIAVTDEGRYDFQISVNSSTIKGTKKEMDNVIMIPKKAVTSTVNEYGVGYVDVLNDDGSIIRTPFLMGPSLGGENGNYYWAIDGLTEGTEVVCWE